MKNVAADLTYSSSADTPLLPGRTRPCCFAMRYGRSRKCVTSRAALLILLWSLVAGLLRGLFLNPDILYLLMWYLNQFELTVYGVTAFFTCFFPLAGFLADVKCGRYKIVVISLCIISVSAFVLMLMSGLYFAFWRVGYYSLTTVALAACLASIFVVNIGLTGFTANVVQFGMDQLHDSPGEDRTLFIHWYVWTYYASILIETVAWNLVIQLPYKRFHFSAFTLAGLSLIVLVLLLVIVVLPTTLCLARHRRRWFLIEPGQYNPYKLVYRVTKFVRQHKTPVCRSAFTYCEDKVPRGLDLGKDKYGGPFTTEQVEDVKTFYGILKVLFALGIVFFLDFAGSSTMPRFALHMAPYYKNASIDNSTLSIYHIYKGTVIDKILINKGALYSIFMVVSIPLYLCLLRPFISRYVPGMLKRMGLGMVLVVLSLIATLSMDITAHVEDRHSDTACMFRTLGSSFQQNPAYLVIQLTFAGLSRMLIYVGVFEFICSQSPHSMKGLLIGVLYATRGLYQVVAVLLALPYYIVDASMYPSCGFYFYLINIVIGLVAVLVYMCVAKRYRYRVRDELCNVHQYAEEYYSYP